jgi:cyclohexadienyl dehydratase
MALLKALRAFSIFILPFLGLETKAAETSRLDQIMEKGVLRVGTSGDYRPFTFLDKESGQFSGFDIDMAKSLSIALGVKLEFVQTSWPKLSDDLASNKFDIAMGGVSITLERQKKGFFSLPYLRDGKTPISLCKNEKKFQNLSDIDRPDVKVIVNPGGTNEKFDRTFLKKAQIVVFNDNTKIFDEIISGHADVMITDATEARLQQKLHAKILCAVHPSKPFDFAEKAYFLPRDVELKFFVDQWLNNIMHTPAYKDLTVKWIE